MDLTIEKKVQESLGAVREKAKKETEDEQKLKVTEKEEIIAGMQRTIEELKRKSEQGSQQLQGEVLEMELEGLLRSKFPTDAIEPVPKGEFGGDLLQRIVGPLGQACGTILWETKRTKNWSDGWLAKLRVGVRVRSIEAAFQVSGNARDCQFPANVLAGAASGHRVKDGGRPEKPQQVFDKIAATIAGIVAAAVFTGTAEMVEAREMGDGACGARSCAEVWRKRWG